MWRHFGTFAVFLHIVSFCCFKHFLHSIPTRVKCHMHTLWTLIGCFMNSWFMFMLNTTRTWKQEVTRLKGEVYTECVHFGTGNVQQRCIGQSGKRFALIKLADVKLASSEFLPPVQCNGRSHYKKIKNNVVVIFIYFYSEAANIDPTIVWLFIENYNQLFYRNVYWTLKLTLLHFKINTKSSLLVLLQQGGQHKTYHMICK